MKDWRTLSSDDQERILGLVSAYYYKLVTHASKAISLTKNEYWECFV